MFRVWLPCFAMFLLACPSSPSSTTSPSPEKAPEKAPSQEPSNAVDEVFEAKPPAEMVVKDSAAPGDAEALLVKFGAAEQAASDRALTDQEIEDVLKATATCDIVEETGEVATKCAPWALSQSLHNKAIKSGGGHATLIKVAQRHLEHPRAATRSMAVRWHTDFVGVLPEHRERLLRLAVRERHAQPLGSYIRALRPFVGQNPEILKLAKTASSHPVAYVRRHAAYTLATPDAQGLPGVMDRVEMLLLEDQDMLLRGGLCEALGTLGENPRALGLIQKVLASPKLDSKMSESCTRGLIASWTSSVPPKKPSRAAYDATLAMLRHTPRSYNAPNARGLLRLRWAAAPASRKAAPWIEVETLRAALTEVIVDDAVGWIGRAALVGTLVELGATKQELTQLRDVRLKDKDAKSHAPQIRRKIDSMISKM